jgi:hypothetical protein
MLDDTFRGHLSLSVRIRPAIFHGSVPFGSSTTDLMREERWRARTRVMAAAKPSSRVAEACHIAGRQKTGQPATDDPRYQIEKRQAQEHRSHAERGHDCGGTGSCYFA